MGVNTGYLAKRLLITNAVPILRGCHLGVLKEEAAHKEPSFCISSMTVPPTISFNTVSWSGSEPALFFSKATWYTTRVCEALIQAVSLDGLLGYFQTFINANNESTNTFFIFAQGQVKPSKQDGQVEGYVHFTLARLLPSSSL